MRKKSLNIILLVLSVALIVFSFICLREDALKRLNGVCIGIGTGLIGLSIANLTMLNWYKKHPEEKKQSEIDFKDERNEIIRNRAKAKCSDVIKWVIMAVVWITIFTDSHLWLTLTLVGIFIFKDIFELYLINKYNKEM